MKSLRYAYKTSPAATRLNRGQGCWLVDDGSGLPPLVYQDSEKWEALRVFQLVKRPIDSFSSFTIEHAVFNPSTL